MSEFDEATAVGADGAGAIVDGWDIGENANGGYLLALAANHMRAVSGRLDPITVTAHFLSPGTPGPVQIDATAVKRGKRFVTVSGAMHRAGKPLMQVLGAFGDASAGDPSIAHATISPPVLPPFDDCPRRPSGQGTIEVPMMDHLDVRLRPSDARFGSVDRSGVPECAGWFAFVDGRPIDTLALLMICDAFPPAVFNLDLPAGWVPTVELTVHIRGVPAPGPVRCLFRTEVLGGGFLDESGEVWDSRGQLVAMSRQLGLMARAF